MEMYRENKSVGITSKEAKDINFLISYLNKNYKEGDIIDFYNADLEEEFKGYYGFYIQQVDIKQLPAKFFNTKPGTYSTESCPEGVEYVVNGREKIIDGKVTPFFHVVNPLCHCSFFIVINRTIAFLFEGYTKTSILEGLKYMDDCMAEGA